MSDELRLICVMAGVLVALGIACIREWVLMYRAEKQLQSERWFKRGSKELKRTGFVPGDIQ